MDDRLLLINFPKATETGEFAHYLRRKFGPDFLVFNLSEHSYPTEPFLNQVVECVFPGYPCPPLEAIFTTCRHIHSWLRSGPEHVAFLHCQATRVPSSDTRNRFEAAW